MLGFLRKLGLNEHVDEQCWLKVAAKFAAKANSSSQDSTDYVKRCEILLSTLKEMIKEPHAFSSSFLGKAYNIPFIHTPDKCEVEELIITLTGHQLKKSRYRQFMSFNGAVWSSNSSLASLCSPVLPPSCDFLKECDSQITHALNIKEPLSVQSVVSNLEKLIDALCCSKAAARPATVKVCHAIERIKEIFDQHYKFLEEKGAHDECIDSLIHTRCILLTPDKFNYILVQPKQVVEHIPSEYDFRPFCYRVPPELKQFGMLMKRLEVHGEMSPYQYIEILADIKKEMVSNRAKLTQDSQYLKICKSAYNALIICLRQPNARKPSDMKDVVLLSDDLQLVEISDLVYCDSPWIADRLQASQQLEVKLLFSPPPDENGQRIPPPCLMIKPLSSIAVEMVSTEVDDQFNRCKDDELFITGTRTQPCPVVGALRTTLISPLFATGLQRLYWHENHKNPKENCEFVTALEELPKCEIKCVQYIPTTIHVHGRAVNGTDNNKKCCHIVSGSAGVVMYISHYHSDQYRFFEQLATAVISFFKQCFRNEAHIQSIFRCDPLQIESILDSRQVEPYDTSKAYNIKGEFKVGQKYEGHLCDEERLLLCNISKDEMVLCQKDNGDIVYARVIENNYDPTCSVTDKCYELSVDEASNKTVKTCPLQVYKILNTTQRNYLTSDQPICGMHMSPVTHIPLPSESEINNWLREAFQSSNKATRLFVSLRLICHLNYVLRKHGSPNNHLFLESSRYLLEIVERAASDESQVCCVRVKALVRKLAGLPYHDMVFGNSSLPSQITMPNTGDYSSPSSSNQSSYPYYPAVMNTTNGFAQPSQQQTFWSSNYSSHSSSVFQSSSRILPTRSRIPQSVSSTTRPAPEPDERSAKMWLLQAKADYLSAKYLFIGDETEEEGVCGAGRDDSSCKFPALVCFLSHEAAEKCIKGVLYAKCGLSSQLVNSSLIVELQKELDESSSIPDELKQVVNHCSMQLNQHSIKTRYPNYQLPPCAPAEVYSSLQAREALAAVTCLINEVVKIPELNQLIGDIEVPPIARFPSVLSPEGYPKHWAPQDKDVAVILLDDESEEYQGVAALFLLSLPNCRIERIDRIQNKLLWNRYSSCASRMLDFGQIPVEFEKMLFHGTRNHKPEKIYKGDASFDMRFSRVGMWGRGNYFAVNASYSNSYAYTRHPSNARQMLVANVLTGHSYATHPDSTLTMPPYRSDGTAESALRRRYDSVTGETGGSTVYITYDNEKAYPAYLITYNN